MIVLVYTHDVNDPYKIRSETIKKYDLVDESNHALKMCAKVRSLQNFFKHGNSQVEEIELFSYLRRKLELC